MKFGISSFAFGWAIGFEGARPARAMDEHDLIRAAVAHGAEALQIADNLALENFSADRLSRLKHSADASGIQLEVGARQLTTDRIATYAAIARELGSSFIRFVIDGAAYHPTREQIEDTIRAALPMLDGLVLAIENHDRFSTATLRELLESIDSAQVGICLDTANSLGAGEGIETVLRQLAPWTVNLHVKDIAIRRIDTMMGFHVEGRAAGDGQLDIPSIIAAVRNFGRCQSATLELWTPREMSAAETIAKEADWVSRSCRYLKPLIH